MLGRLGGGRPTARPVWTINVLVNNAAVMPVGGASRDQPGGLRVVSWQSICGDLLVCGAVIPGMLGLEAAASIHIAASRVHRSCRVLAAYSMTKGALIALTRAMSTDYAARGIRANSVSPGTIDSPMLHEFVAWQSDPEGLLRQYDAMHPLGRVGSIDDVANVCLFLASDEASFVTGANYTVDGGISVKGEQPQD